MVSLKGSCPVHGSARVHATEPAPQALAHRSARAARPRTFHAEGTVCCCSTVPMQNNLGVYKHVATLLQAVHRVATQHNVLQHSSTRCNAVRLVQRAATQASLLLLWWWQRHGQVRGRWEARRTTQRGFILRYRDQTLGCVLSSLCASEFALQSLWQTSFNPEP